VDVDVVDDGWLELVAEGCSDVGEQATNSTTAPKAAAVGRIRNSMWLLSR
jgi:hypothetical protein